MHNNIVAFIAGFIFFSLAAPIALSFLKMLGLYTIVYEREAKVFTLFGKVLATIKEPGLHFLFLKLGINAPLVALFGKTYTLDLRLDQRYLRSQPVNSEEGAPMGIGIWYEMFISDPVAFLFKNSDPSGSLAANIGNATVRCLSNMKLADMLQNRHYMSDTVRTEVIAHSKEWGYDIGSVYIRKVHFRDKGMIEQIQAKVVNRLKQVTSAIKQDGDNKVNIIQSTAEQTAAVELAKASKVRPEVIGAALKTVVEDKEVVGALFDILETNNLIDSKAAITIVPNGYTLLSQLAVAKGLS